MDVTIAHMLAKLDAIERAIGDLRLELAKKTKLSFRVKNMSPFAQSLTAGGLIWTVGISSKAFLDNGGDPASLILALAKLALGFFFGAG